MSDHDTSTDTGAEQELYPAGADAVAFLELDTDTTRQTLWVTRHNGPRLILCTFPAVPIDGGEMPGLTRELYVPRATGAESDAEKIARLFDATVREFAAAGWTPDPWALPDPTDQPCPF